MLPNALPGTYNVHIIAIKKANKIQRLLLTSNLAISTVSADPQKKQREIAL